jgi:hypothetical protein
VAPLMVTARGSSRPAAPGVSRSLPLKEPRHGREGRGGWLPENWVDGFDFGENRLGRIL